MDISQSAQASSLLAGVAIVGLLWLQAARRRVQPAVVVSSSRRRRSTAVAPTIVTPQ